jgi:hypothetical protein
MKRFASITILLAAAALIGTASAGASGNSVTIRTLSGGAGGPLPSAPAASCLTTSDPFAIIEANYTGSIHENLVSKNAVHIVADLNVTFDVRDEFGTHIAWQGAGHIAIDQSVPLTFADGIGTAMITVTVPVAMLSSDGTTANVNWPIQVWAFSTPDGVLPGVLFDPGAVTCG